MKCTFNTTYKNPTTLRMIHKIQAFHEIRTKWFFYEINNTMKILLQIQTGFNLRSQLIFTCSKSTIETLENDAFIVNFEYISHLYLALLLLTLNK